MRVILTRHYKTLSNAEGRILGWGDSPPCPGWQDDVDFIGKQLRENGVGFDAVYSSDLERSRQTARAYASSFNIAEVISTSALKEINYGQLQTREKSWVKEHYPLYKKDPGFIFPEGESFQQMQQRSVGFLASLALTHPEKSILIVCHAGVVRGLVCHFLNLDFASSLKHGIPFRYIGDFRFEGDCCLHYDEIGKPSGFVRDEVIQIPYAVTRTDC